MALGVVREELQYNESTQKEEELDFQQELFLKEQQRDRQSAASLHPGLLSSTHTHYLDSVMSK